MSAELFTVERRARIHSALADHARLAIVDTLVVGDAAPGELGSALGLPTNLIAHHLKALEDAGLVVRTRSEGDRRRSYVRLRPEVLTAITAPALLAADLADARRVVFVCTHNSARSQLAAAIWARRSHLPAVSAGTEPAARVHPRAVKIARRHGLDPRGWRTAHINAVPVRGDDLLIAVCDNAHEHLPSTTGDRRLHWSIPDPAPLDADPAFEVAYTELTDRIDRLAPTLSTRS